MTGPAARVRAVNVGLPREQAWAGIGRTSIDKRPVPGRVAVTRRGLAGDRVSDVRFHGGVDQAVYAFARENLTTEGIDVNEALVGSAGGWV